MRLSMTVLKDLEGASKPGFELNMIWEIEKNQQGEVKEESVTLRKTHEWHRTQFWFSPRLAFVLT